MTPHDVGDIPRGEFAALKHQPDMVTLGVALCGLALWHVKKFNRLAQRGKIPGHQTPEPGSPLRRAELLHGVNPGS